MYLYLIVNFKLCVIQPWAARQILDKPRMSFPPSSLAISSTVDRTCLFWTDLEITREKLGKILRNCRRSPLSACKKKFSITATKKQHKKLLTKAKDSSSQTTAWKTVRQISSRESIIESYWFAATKGLSFYAEGVVICRVHLRKYRPFI